MKILFVADNFPPEKNAQASRVYERACYWARWGHQVTVITCAPNFPEGSVYQGYKNSWYYVEEMSGIRVVRTKSLIASNSGTVIRTLDFISFMLTSFAVGLIQRKPDVVAATSPQFFAAISGCVLSIFKRVPFVMEVSDLWPDSIVAVGAMKQSPIIRVLERIELALYARAKRVVLLTHAFRENLKRRNVPDEKLDVVRNGADLQRYTPCARDAELARKWDLEGCFVIGYIGTLGMAHALDNVLKAAAKVTDPTVRFLFVGPGADRDCLVARAAEMELRNVIFIPPQPKSEMPRYWSLCDVSLVHLKNTPLFETVIPSKIFEAMAMGLPIL
ncbi:MAG: glycosyltransferase family 4 protein, partial [Acidobacteriaceae bacterium]|nr:glycosyltransferase family 4 protein [Acidobacteriaceae bacterium]